MNRVFTLAVAAFVLVACADGPSKQTLGTGLGGIGGGLAGAQFGRGSGNLAATAGGALLGAMIGNSVGSSLDRMDAASAGPAYRMASPPVVYATGPAPATYRSRPDYVAPAPTSTYTAPSSSIWSSSGPTPLPGGCRTVGNGIWCE